MVVSFGNKSCTIIKSKIIDNLYTFFFIFRFLFPCSLVVVNDTAAYVCGRIFGKRKLLNISPNKTLEGFVGAGIITVLFAFKVIIYMYINKEISRFNWYYSTSFQVGYLNLVI